MRKIDYNTQLIRQDLNEILRRLEQDESKQDSYERINEQTIRDIAKSLRKMEALAIRIGHDQVNFFEHHKSSDRG